MGGTAGVLEPGHPQSKRVGGGRQLVTGFEPATVDRRRSTGVPPERPCPMLRGAAPRTAGSTQWTTTARRFCQRGVLLCSSSSSSTTSGTAAVYEGPSGGEPRVSPRHRVTALPSTDRGLVEAGIRVRAEPGQEELPRPVPVPGWAWLVAGAIPRAAARVVHCAGDPARSSEVWRLSC